MSMHATLKVIQGYYRYQKPFFFVYFSTKITKCTNTLNNMELYTLYFIDKLFLYDCDAFICVSELS